MGKEIKFSILLKVSDMYEFLLRHAYTSLAGLIGVGISLLALVLFFVGLKDGSDVYQNILLLVIASLFLIINPLQLRLKAKQQVLLNPMFTKPIYYLFTKEHINVRQNDEQLELAWKDVYKVVETKNLFILYFSRVTGYIIPKEQISDFKRDFIQLIVENVDEKLCRLQ
ncbi:MAG TPA: YcxB family protein [Lachnospiraceae bacterium]|nr:YcxB family protein [Lachnospiraceae bacterium]